MDRITLDILPNFATKFIKNLKKNSVVAFWGDLGTGKTTLIKYFISLLHEIDPNEIGSPTFPYLQIYEGNPTIYHFDLYRLKKEKEFEALGFDEFLQTDGICFIEWPEKIISLLPQNTIHIELEYEGLESRKIHIRS